MLQLSNIYIRNTLKGLNLTISKGEFVFIIGANGAGKTTLFNIISGCERPASGKVLIKNKDISLLPQYKRANWISSVLQDPKIGTVGEMTLLENLTVSYNRGKKRNLYVKNKRDFFQRKLSAFNLGLENRLDEYVGDLSGGQRQVLSLIMATMTNYDILLLDEITSALDPTAANSVIEATKKIVLSEKKTCLFITHDMQHINKIPGTIVEILDGCAVYRNL